MKQKKVTYYGLRAFLSYGSQHKAKIIFISLGYAFANVCLTIIPIFIGMLVGELAKPETNQITVQILLAILIGCSILHQISWHGIELFFVKYILPPVFSFEELLMKKVIEKPYPYFTDKFTGKISANINTISQETYQFTFNYFYSYVTEIVRLVSISLILLSINIQTLVVFLGGLLMMLFIGNKTLHTSVGFEKKLTDISSSKTGWIVDSIANFSNIKSFHTEKRELNSHLTQLIKTTKASQESNKWSIIFWASVGTVVRFFIWPVTIVMNVILYQQGDLSLAQLTTLLSAILLFSDYIWSVVGSIIRFNLNTARLEEAYTYLFGYSNIAKEHENTLLNSSTLLTFKKRILFDNLSFSYPDQPEELVLKNITLEIKHGEKLGIVGRSGSGKSTLTKLLLGYYQIDDGSIYIDSSQVSSRDLSTFVSFVPQDPSLFHRTLGENIAYAAQHQVTQEDIEKAAKKANAHEFILKTEDGYNSLVGERGIKLSGGQRQRIAIARAILRQAPILVLDEATSALDSESEKMIQKSLDQLINNQTTIVIAHRLSTIAKMDRIIVLDQGEIVEQGNHSELLSKNGLYAELWSHQSGGFIEE